MKDVSVTKIQQMLIQRVPADEGDSGTSSAQVGIIMGSDSDLATMRAAAEVLRDFSVQCEVTVVSAHRTPDRMLEYARAAHERGIKVSAHCGILAEQWCIIVVEHPLVCCENL